MPGMKLGGVQAKSDARQFLVEPIEPAIQNLQAKVAVDYQILSGGLIRRQAAETRGVLPHPSSLVRFLLADQVAEVFKNSARLEGLSQLRELIPYLRGVSSLFLCHQNIQQGEID